MKRIWIPGTRLFWVVCLTMLLVASLPTLAMAEGGTVFDEINNGKTTSSNAPAGEVQQPAAIPGSETGSMLGYLVQVIFSLGFIIVLIYGVLRFLGKKQLGQTQGPIKIISAAPLGNGKTLQVIMIGDRLYIVGVGENVQLLKEIEPGEEADVILADAEIPLLRKTFSWLPFGKKKDVEEEMLFTGHMDGKSFEELLNSQWNDQKKRPVQKKEWGSEEPQDRGDRR